MCRPPFCRCRACLLDDIAALEKRLNTPEVEDFAVGVVAEAQHQRARYSAEHDAGKSPLDWFWLIGFLAQKAASAAISGDRAKALHHTISTAAALANWHAALAGGDNSMRPGIADPEVAAETVGPRENLIAAGLAVLGIRPSNWDDADDPEQVAAWTSLEASLRERGALSPLPVSK